MQTLSHHFLSMAFNNAWANYRLLAACARLTQADFMAPRTGFFPSLCATLNHNLTVDRFYVDALERELRGEAPHPDIRRFFEPPVPCDACADLQREQAAVDRRLLTYCRQMNDADLTRMVSIARPNGTQRDSRARLLAHLFQHQIHHRGQAHAMLAGTGIAPPQLDEFFCSNDAALRAPDFAALGWREADIWGEPASPQTPRPT